MVGGEWDGGTLEPNAPSKVVRLVTRDPGDPTWMSQEVSKRLVSVLYPQYAPFVSRLYPITNHLLTSWHIQVAAKKTVRMGKNIRSTHSDPHPISSNKWYFWEMYENMATWPKLGYCREATLKRKRPQLPCCSWGYRLQENQVPGLFGAWICEFDMTFQKKIKIVGCFWRFWIQQNDPKSVSLASWYALRNLTACPLKIGLLPTKGMVSSSSPINFQGRKMIPCLKVQFSARNWGNWSRWKLPIFQGQFDVSFRDP